MIKKKIRDLFQIRLNYEIGKKSWFGTGGKALVFFKANSTVGLKRLIKLLPSKVPLLIVGACSNIIIRDGGYKGIVIKLGNEFKNIKFDKRNMILKIGAAAKDSEISKFCLDHSIGGFEFLSGIPGTLGGNIKMNAGCYGNEICSNLSKCILLKKNGKLTLLNRHEIIFGYRKSSITNEDIILEAEFKVRFKNKEMIANKIKKIVSERKKTQPIASRTGGSTFSNPKSEMAWKLIDKIKFRGKKYGGALVSEKHSNFLINYDNASSLDLEILGEEIRQKIFEEFNIKLDWELKRIGEFKKI